jgi:hypothetical protein
MNLSPPKQITFIAGVVLWIVGLLGMLTMPSAYQIINLGAAYWIGMLGGLVLILGCVLEGF